jgi:hypothetical protein
VGVRPRSRQIDRKAARRRLTPLAIEILVAACALADEPFAQPSVTAVATASTVLEDLP